VEEVREVAEADIKVEGDIDQLLMDIQYDDAGYLPMMPII